jgi:gluconokinase
MLLTIDVGTSSTRALCVEGRGEPLPGVEARVGGEPHATRDGGAELDRERLVRAVEDGVDGCLALTNDSIVGAEVS